MRRHLCILLLLAGCRFSLFDSVPPAGLTSPQHPTGAGDVATGVPAPTFDIVILSVLGAAGAVFTTAKTIRRWWSVRKEAE